MAALGLGNPDVLPLWFGETDLVTPKFIRDAATAALEDGKTFYTIARGILPLREAMAAFPQAHHRRRHRGGAHHRAGRRHAGGDVARCNAWCETGDNIVIVSPIWPNIFQAAKIAGAEPRLVRLEEDWSSGQLAARSGETVRRLRRAHQGVLHRLARQSHRLDADARTNRRQILEFARARGIAIISDEVYGTLVYDGTAHAPSFLSHRRAG